MLRHAIRIYKMTTRFIRDESGGMITLTAFMFPMIIGFAGLGIDATSWYMERRILQNMADMGSLEGAHSSDYYTGDPLSTLVTTLLSKEGYHAATDTVVVSHPPISGGFIGDMGFVEVTTSRNVNLYMLSAFYGLMGETPTIVVSARAVAGDVVTGEQCIVALDETADGAMSFDGTADVDAACGVASNSTSSTAIDINGTANLTASPAQAVGDIDVAGSATLTTASPIQTYAPKVEDPYEGLAISTRYPDGCGTSSSRVNENGPGGNDAIDFGTPRVIDNGNGEVPALDENGLQYLDLKPGRYCGGLSLNTKDYHVVLGVEEEQGGLATGEYIIDDGDFNVSAQTVVSGAGVSIFLTADIADDIGTINKVNGGADLTLSAPTEGEYKGILFYQDSRATTSTAAAFTGGAAMTFDGALYFPNSEITFTGGSSADPTCMQIIGKTVSFTGVSVIGNDPTICQSLGLAGTFEMIRVELVE